MCFWCVFSCVRANPTAKIMFDTKGGSECATCCVICYQKYTKRKNVALCKAGYHRSFFFLCYSETVSSLTIFFSDVKGIYHKHNIK